MKKTLKFRALAMLMAMSLVLTSCGTTTGSNEDLSNIIVLNNANEPGSLNPALATGTHDSWILIHLFEGLYTKTETGEVQYAGATSAEVSEDGLTWTFYLDENAKWSNGDPVLASDYVYSWLFCLDPNNGAQYSSQLYVIEGAEEYNSNTDETKNEELKANVGVKAIDDYTLEVKLVSPVPYFPDLLTHYTFYPINEKNATEHPDWYTSPENYVSNGPFYLAEWQHKERIKLRKNEYYVNADKVTIDGIDFLMIDDKSTEWQMYQEGELSLVYQPLPSVTDQLMTEGSEELHFYNNLGTYYYIFNTEKVPYNNPKVRQALSMSIDRQVLVDSVLKSGKIPAYTITSRGITMQDGTDFVDYVGPTFTESTPEEAQALLEEGLAEEGMTIDEFEPTILYNTNDTNKKIAEAIQMMWEENLGITVHLENAEFQVCLDRKSTGDYEIASAGWIGDYVDPLTFLETQVTYNDLNQTGYDNPEFDALIEASKNEQDQSKRYEYLKEAEQLLMQDMPLMPIYYYNTALVISPNIEGVVVPVNKMPVVTYATIN